MVSSKRSFASTLVLGCSLVLVCVICCATALGFFGLSIVDRKAGNLFEVAEIAIGSLPEWAESLPPAVADLVNDERRPDYADRLDVSVELAEAYRGRGVRPMVVVRNTGNEVVSLVSMRIVVFNGRGEPVCESNEWAATPIAADDGWRGPLLPGAERHFAADGWFTGKGGLGEDLSVRYEITDVRVWHRDGVDSAALTRAR